MRDLEKADARVFVRSVKWNDEKKSRWAHITRYSNHGNLIEDGGWAACIIVGAMNPWYLGNGRRWRYKYGVRFESADAAWDAVRHSFSITVSVYKEDDEADTGGDK